MATRCASRARTARRPTRARWARSRWAGENISTTELENVLAGHPRIAEAAVIGVADPIRDQAVKAFVLPAAGARITEEEVLAYCEEHMAGFKVPSYVEIVDSFPRTCSMKIEKKLLK